MSWFTRTKGVGRQIGIRFRAGAKKKLPAKISTKIRDYDTFSISRRISKLFPKSKVTFDNETKTITVLGEDIKTFVKEMEKMGFDVDSRPTIMDPKCVCWISATDPSSGVSVDLQMPDDVINKLDSANSSAEKERILSGGKFALQSH